MDENPGRWKFYPHTADAKYEAYGKTIEELFSNAATACMEVMTDTSLIKEEQKHDITIKAKRLESLLYDFLDELLFILDTEGTITKNAQNLTIKETEEGYELRTTLTGDSHKHYDITSDVKAITYSDMIIEQKENGTWRCMVVVDI